MKEIKLLKNYLERKMLKKISKAILMNLYLIKNLAVKTNMIIFWITYLSFKNIYKIYNVRLTLMIKFK